MPWSPIELPISTERLSSEERAELEPVVKTNVLELELHLRSLRINRAVDVEVPHEDLVEYEWADDQALKGIGYRVNRVLQWEPLADGSDRITCLTYQLPGGIPRDSSAPLIMPDDYELDDDDVDQLEHQPLAHCDLDTQLKCYPALCLLAANLHSR